MKNKVKLYLALIVLTGLTGCAGMTAIFTSHGRLTSTAESDFAKGDFDGAVRNTVKALIIKPEYEKAQRLLVSSFNPAVLKHEESIAALTGSKKLDDLSQLVNDNQILVELNSLVKNLPPVVDKKTNQTLTFEIKDFSDALFAAKKVAAEGYYLEGKRIGKEGGIGKCRIASDHFKRVLSYIPRYRDAAELAEKYQKAGTKRVAIIPFLLPEDQSQYKALGEKIVENFKRAMILLHKDEMEYLDFVPYSELSNVLSKYDLGQHGLQFSRQNAIKIGKELAAHELIIGDISEFSITPPETTENKKQETTKIKTTRKKTPAEVLKGRLGNKFLGGNAKDSDMVVEYVDLTADIKIHELKAGAVLKGAYNVINLQKVSSHESSLISGEYTFGYQWASFSGDERALSKETKKLLKHKADKKAPGEIQIVNNALNDFSKSLLSNLEGEVSSVEGYL